MILNGNNDPSLYEAVQYLIMQRIAQLNVGIPGCIVSFDEKEQLAEVNIDISQLYQDGTSVQIPPLQDVPVERVRSNSGNSYIITPIKVGDKGWVKFSQRTIDGWLQDGKQQDMTNLRMYDFSDAVFFPGLYPSSNKITENNTDVIIRNEGSRHIIGDDSHALESKSKGFIKINKEKVSIGNDKGEILSLMNDLLSQLLIAFGASPAGPAPLDPATKVEITRIQTLLNQIRGS